MTLLDVSGLTIAFPRATPVIDFGFSVAEGETVAVVGESGSGKSLTALAIMRLLPRTARIASGTIRFRAATSWRCRNRTCARCAAARSR